MIELSTVTLPVLPLRNGRYYRTRQTPGITASVGLGLTVSQELAQLMGGGITYHHDGEAVFTVRLPVAERSSVAAPPAARPAALPEPALEPDDEPIPEAAALPSLDFLP